MEDAMDEEIEEDITEDVFRKALGMDTEEAFLDVLAEGAPMDFCKSYLSIRACGRDRFRKDKRVWTPEFTIDQFDNVPHVLQDYADYINSDITMNRPKSLMIIGPTCYGKTQWARTINTNHSLMGTEWNVAKIDPDGDVLIFDDTKFSELIDKDRWKAFIGMQQEIDVSGKYKAPIGILRSWKAFIWTCNIDLRDQEGVTEHMKDYITSNMFIVKLEEPLFKEYTD